MRQFGDMHLTMASVQQVLFYGNEIEEEVVFLERTRLTGLLKHSSVGCFLLSSLSMLILDKMLVLSTGIFQRLFSLPLCFLDIS